MKKQFQHGFWAGLLTAGLLLALGLKHETAHGSLRLSLSGENTMEDVDYILEQLPPIVQRLRDMSPVWEKMMKEEQN